MTTAPERPDAPGSDPDASWRELMALVFEGTASAESRLEALIDHVERGHRPVSRTER